MNNIYIYNMKKTFWTFFVLTLFVLDLQAQPNTYTTQATYINANINANGARAITGTMLNTALNYLLINNNGVYFDATRPYKTNQLAVYGTSIYISDSIYAAGAWNASHWTLVASVTDTTSLSNRIDTKINIVDTNTFAATIWYVDSLINAIVPIDTTSLSNRIDTKINITDTNTYVATTWVVDSLINAIPPVVHLAIPIDSVTHLQDSLTAKLNKSDSVSLSSIIATASVGNADSLGHDIASTYVQFVDTNTVIATTWYVDSLVNAIVLIDTISLSNRIDKKLNITDTNTFVSTVWYVDSLFNAVPLTDSTVFASKSWSSSVFPYKSQTWLLAGNAGNDSSGTQFLGNTTIYPLILKTNNIERLRITGSGKFGIGTSTPNAGLEIISPSPSATHSSLLLGDNLTNNTAKLSSISARNYANAEEPVCLLYHNSGTSSNNIMYIGGGLATQNSVNSMRFLTGGNTTVAGSLRFVITNDGKFSFGSGATIAATAPSYILTFAGVSAFTMGISRNVGANLSGVDGTWIMSGSSTASANRKNGGMARLRPGISTDAGYASIRLQSYTRLTALTGGTDNTEEDRLVIPSVKNLVDNANDTLFTLTLTSDSTFAGVIHYSVIIQTDSATTWRNQQAEIGEISFTGSKHKGIIYYNVDIDHEREKFTSGTLTSTFTPVLTAGVVYFIVKYDSSLNPTAGQIKARYIVQNNSSATLTQF